jgi:hypothetical protein
MTRKRMLAVVLLASLMVLGIQQGAMAAERVVQLKIPGCG